MANVVHCIAAQVVKGRNIAARHLNCRSDPFYIVRWVGGTGARDAPITGPLASMFELKQALSKNTKHGSLLFALSYSTHYTTCYAQLTSNDVLQALVHLFLLHQVAASNNKPVSLDKVASLEVEVWDYNKFGANDFMGSVSIKLTARELEQRINTQFELFLPLQRADLKSVSGDLCITIMYTKILNTVVDRESRSVTCDTAGLLQVRIMRGRKIKVDSYYVATWITSLESTSYCSEKKKSSVCISSTAYNYDENLKGIFNVVTKTNSPNWYSNAMKKGLSYKPMQQRLVDISHIDPIEIEVFHNDKIGATLIGKVMVNFTPKSLQARDGELYYFWYDLEGKPVKKASFADVRRTQELHGITPTAGCISSGRICLEIKFASRDKMLQYSAAAEEKQRYIATHGYELKLNTFTVQTHPLSLAVTTNSELEQLFVKAINTKITTSSNTRRMQTYHNSFMGSDAVDLLMSVLAKNKAIQCDSLIKMFQEGGAMQKICDTETCTAAFLKLLTANCEGWERQDATLVMQCLLANGRIKRVASNSSTFVDSNSLYKIENPGAEELSKMMKASKAKTIGSCFKESGHKPKYPVVLVPGLASSALEVWESNLCPHWVGERLWIDPFKIGNLAQVKKLGQLFQPNTTKTNVTGFASLRQVSQMQQAEQEPQKQRISFTDTESQEAKIDRPWLKHLMPQPDGWSDPPGIRVRPCSGLGAIDYLLHMKGPLKQQSYVWSYIIDAFIEVGYDKRNLLAAPYDWRIPPQKMEERDGYFTGLKGQIDVAVEVNKEKVVLIGHSMGNRTIQYFLFWVQKKAGQQWIDDHIHAYMALGAPFLGAPKIIRGLLTGDALGLDMFLVMSETMQLAKRLGSLPWLLPVDHRQYPQQLCYVLNDEKADPNDSNKYETPHAFDLIQQKSMQVWNTFETFYKEDEFHLNGAADFGTCMGPNYQPTSEPPPLLAAPPIKRLWCIYGINLHTETSYYFKDKGDVMRPDTSADKLSEVQSVSNPAALKISNGIGFETFNTKQPILGNRRCSGDATLPYASMAYAREWRKAGVDVDILEIEGAEHRAMMSDKCVIFHILKYCTTGENAYAQIDLKLYNDRK